MFHSKLWYDKNCKLTNAFCKVSCNNCKSVKAAEPGFYHVLRDLELMGWMGLSTLQLKI